MKNKWNREKQVTHYTQLRKSGSGDKWTQNESGLLYSVLTFQWDDISRKNTSLCWTVAIEDYLKKPCIKL